MKTIINRLAREKVVEGIAANIGVNGTDRDDLAQMVYEILLTSNPDKISELDERGELRYWITRIIKNQWLSKTSPFYQTYKKYYSLIEDKGITTEDDDDDD